MLTIGLEPILLKEEEDFKSPAFTKLHQVKNLSKFMCRIRLELMALNFSDLRSNQTELPSY